jgi:crossover junction endodeoxyribonuclease RusA
MKVNLPWPPKELSPNFRGHWAAVYKRKKEYKEDCWILCKQAKLTKPDGDRIVVNMKFFPPTKHARDQDNMVAAMKAGLDGVAAAMGVDDSLFDIKIEVAQEFSNKVEITIAGWRSGISPGS